MNEKFKPQYQSVYTKVLEQQYDVKSVQPKNFYSRSSTTGYRIGRVAVSNETKNSKEGLKRA